MPYAIQTKNCEGVSQLGAKVVDAEDPSFCRGTRLASRVIRVHHKLPLSTNLWSRSSTASTAKMPGVLKSPAKAASKRVLQDASTSRQNIQSTSPSKRRKLNGAATNGFKKPGNGPAGSQQQKSHFEEEVLEKLTQDISGLRKKNAEKDQQWARPGLDDFNEKIDTLCFQQIEAEEGTLHGGKTTVKLFGVTEVFEVVPDTFELKLTHTRPATPLFFT